MKKMILILSLITGLTVTASAQGFRLNLQGGYVFDDGIKSYDSPTNFYDGTVKGGFQWGLGAEYVLASHVGLEFKYLHQDTKAPFSYYNNGVKNKEFDMGVSYYLFGATYYFQLENKMIEPYFGGSLGWANLKAKTDSSGSSTRSAFAWGLKGGSNIWFGKKVGLKVQAEFLSASAATGGAYFWTYYGPIYADTYTTLYQFGLSTGLVFRFGN